MDFTFQTVTAILGWLTLAGISLGGAIFKLSLLNLTEDDFTCKIIDSDYSGAKAIMDQFTSTEACLEKADDLFKIIDQDDDGYISRCEDASFQVAMGSEEAFALKYSTTWSLAAAKKWCYMKH